MSYSNTKLRVYKSSFVGPAWPRRRRRLRRWQRQSSHRKGPRSEQARKSSRPRHALSRKVDTCLCARATPVDGTKQCQRTEHEDRLAGLVTRAASCWSLELGPGLSPAPFRPKFPCASRLARLYTAKQPTGASQTSESRTDFGTQCGMTNRYVSKLFSTRTGPKLEIVEHSLTRQFCEGE